jgi:hypothetical protein
MNTRVMTSMLLLVAATAALALGANAQEGPALPRTDAIEPAAVAEVGSEPGPNQFGSNWFTKVIPASAFIPASSDDKYSGAGLGYLTSTAGGNFWAPLDMPPGTEVQQVCIYVRDTSTSGTIWAAWGTVRMGDSTEGPGITFQGSNVETGLTATPGYAVLCTGPATPVQIRAVGDVDGDGDTEANWHYVAILASAQPGIEWSGASVTWRRAMSPAPATATFPTDVPTSHPFFRYVEALYASGITAGCGSGYCPDNPVTRGQMAVFLTKALGLYWPY